MRGAAYKEVFHFDKLVDMDVYHIDCFHILKKLDDYDNRQKIFLKKLSLFFLKTCQLMGIIFIVIANPLQRFQCAFK